MGFGNVLGGVAAGFEQARQADAQRSFEAEQNRRAQIGGFLQKLAMDETVHPYTRNAAAQQYLGLVNTPPLKPWKPDIESLVPPAQPKQQMNSPGLTAPSAPPAAQPQFTPGGPGAAPQMSMPQPPPGLSQAMQGAGAGTVTGPPAQSPGAFLSPTEVTQMQASRIGALTGAQAGQEMGSQVYTRGPGNQLNVVPLSKGGAPLPAIQNAVSPFQLQGRGLRPTVYIDPADGQPKIGSHNLLTGEVMDQNDTVVPNAVPFESSMVTKGTTSTESMGASGAITKKNVTGPVKAGQSGAGGAQSTQTSGNSAKPVGSPHLTSGGLTNWADDDSPVGLAAQRWATQGQAPKGGAMAERQVLSYMKQHGLQPALPVPPGLQQKIQQSFVARNSAIGLIDDIQKNSDVLDSLITAGKIQTAMNPSTGAALVTRATDLTDKEAKVAGDYQQLVEHVNLLRGPLGATGFRGPEAWAALQAQRGNLLSDPRITRQVLAGMRDRLAGLNNADKMILSGQGMSAPAAPSAMTRIKASDGSLHDIPSDKMDQAKQRDPGLTVVQ